MNRNGNRRKNRKGSTGSGTRDDLETRREDKSDELERRVWAWGGRETNLAKDKHGGVNGREEDEGCSRKSGESVE